jgi:predicted Fe-S protein YdhL (DUF1289 family)
MSNKARRQPTKGSWALRRRWAAMTPEAKNEWLQRVRQGMERSRYRPGSRQEQNLNGGER